MKYTISNLFSSGPPPPGLKYRSTSRCICFSVTWLPRSHSVFSNTYRFYIEHDDPLIEALTSLFSSSCTPLQFNKVFRLFKLYLMRMSGWCKTVEIRTLKYLKHTCTIYNNGNRNKNSIITNVINTKAQTMTRPIFQ